MKTHHWTLILLVLLCAGIGGAQQRCVTVQPTKSVQSSSYVAPSASLVPAYGGSFNSTDDILLQILAENKAIKDEVKGLRADIAGLKGQGGAQPQNGNVTLGGVVGKYCFACHGAETADKLGGGFQMVSAKGELELFSSNERNKIIRVVNSGSMPKKKEGEQAAPKLSEAEKKVFEEINKEAPK